MNKHALPPGKIKRNFSTQWKCLFSKVLEEGLKARGMEHFLEPTATPEEFKVHCDNCKVVLSERVSHFCEGGKGLQGTVSTWASRASWGQIVANGTASDEEKNPPRDK